ncbi:MAG: hypothetical protein PHO46_02960 [Thermoguttaceae bacterium]|nr:hypothetical protein [Thermoguttaceae bacterium]
MPEKREPQHEEPKFSSARSAAEAAVLLAYADSQRVKKARLLGSAGHARVVVDSDAALSGNVLLGVGPPAFNAIGHFWLLN